HEHRPAARIGLSNIIPGHEQSAYTISRKWAQFACAYASPPGPMYRSSADERFGTGNRFPVDQRCQEVQFEAARAEAPLTLPAFKAVVVKTTDLHRPFFDVMKQAISRD